MLFRRGLHLLHGGIRLSKADIIGDGVREQIGPLEHEGEIADGAVIAVFPHIPSAKAHAAGLHIPEPHHKIAQRGLAAARGTDDGDSRFLRNGQGYIVQNGLAAVGEIYMVKFSMSSRSGKSSSPSMSIESYHADVDQRKRNIEPNEDGFSPMFMPGGTVREKKAAGDAILGLCKSMTSPDPIPIGQYRGFDMELSFGSRDRWWVRRRR